MDLKEGDYVVLPEDFCKENLNGVITLGRIWKWVEADSNEVLVTYSHKDTDIFWKHLLCHMFFDSTKLVRATSEEYPELFL